MQNSFMTNEKKLFMRLKMEYYLPFSKKDDMKTDSSNQQPDVLDTPEQIKVNDFLEQIKEEQKYIGMRLFSNYFPYTRPDKMVQNLFNSKTKANNYSKVSFIYGSFDHFAGKVREMPSGPNKKKAHENIENC